MTRATQTTAIVLSAFGTTTTAAATYEDIEKYFRLRFPGYAMVWAFTSSRVRHAVRSRGVDWKSPDEVLSDLHRQGCSRAVVQSLHIVPGEEYDKLVAAARTAAMPVAVGKPLLSSADDCSRVIAALQGLLSVPDGQAVVLAGHGTHHPEGAAMYGLFNQCLRERLGRNVYLSMVEGEPAWPAVHAAIRENGVRSVLFVPFMLVAGEHIMRDVLGDHAGSWRSSLGGIDCTAVRRGLGCNETIREFFGDHLRDVLNL